MRIGLAGAILAIVAPATASCGAPARAGGSDPSFSFDATIAASTESLLCAYVAMPSDRGDMWIDSVDSHYTGGGHHFVIFRTNLAEIPTDGAQLHDCATSGWQGKIARYFYEAQTSDARRTLPAGVAQRFSPGEILLVQAHYVNATPAETATRLSFTMHAVDAKAVDHEAGTLFFYDPKIAIPARGRNTVRVTCPIATDVHLAMLWSHMHSRGVHFEARDGTGALLYESSSWAEPTPREMPAGALLPAGSSLTFACDYENRTDSTITSGLSAITNEMCVLHGTYWPRTAIATEMCDHGMSDGEGRSSARETLDCLTSCGFDGADDCQAHCWDAACPNATMPMTAILRCMDEEDKCSSVCALRRGAECDACLSRRCPDALAAFVDATCVDAKPAAAKPD